MSDLSKKARSDMRAKANRLAGSDKENGRNDPHKKTDASSWVPNESLNTTRKTGARPIRSRIYKAGGKVQGDRAPRHPGKACRGGAMATGGRAARKDGGNVYSVYDTAADNKRDLGSFHEGGYKRGGMPKPGHDMAAIKQSHANPAAHEKDGTYYGGTRPTGGRMPRADGGPVEKPYYVKPKGDMLEMRQKRFLGRKTEHPHDVMAVARNADEMRGMVDKHFSGKVDWDQPEKTPRAHGGRTKGKTNINIVIAQPKAAGGMPQQMPPQGVVRPPMPPPQMQPPAGGPPPMPMPPPGAGGPPPGMPPGAGPMMRKRGGRANSDAIPLTKYGAASGEGRLEKVKIQERSTR